MSRASIRAESSISASRIALRARQCSSELLPPVLRRIVAHRCHTTRKLTINAALATFPHQRSLAAWRLFVTSRCECNPCRYAPRAVARKATHVAIRSSVSGRKKIGRSDNRRRTGGTRPLPRSGGSDDVAWISGSEKCVQSVPEDLIAKELPPAVSVRHHVHPDLVSTDAATEAWNPLLSPPCLARGWSACPLPLGMTPLLTLWALSSHCVRLAAMPHHPMRPSCYKRSSASSMLTPHKRRSVDRCPGLAPRQAPKQP